MLQEWSSRLAHNIQRRVIAMLPKMEPPRASTIELSPCSSREADLARRIKESKRYELIRTEAIASSPKLLSPRYVVYRDVAIVFGMGRSVMKGKKCCNTDSESPTTRGVESDEKASSSVFSCNMGCHSLVVMTYRWNRLVVSSNPAGRRPRGMA